MQRAVDERGQFQTVMEHLRELRRRLLICVLFVLAGSIAGYALQDTLLAIIQKPLGDVLYYTTPGGGFTFIFELSVVFGIVITVPILLYQAIKFIEPAISKLSLRFIAGIVLASYILALGGMAFAYFISLPAALHFLGEFGGDGIRSMITAEAYFSFASKYLLGFAALFQLPLLLLLINRIKPQRPRKLLGIVRYVIVGSFIVAAILTPTPDPINQALMAGPIIALYIVSVGLVALVNRRQRPARSHRAVAPVRPVAHNVPRAPAATKPARPVVGRMGYDFNFVQVNRKTQSAPRPPQSKQPALMVSPRQRYIDAVL